MKLVDRFRRNILSNNLFPVNDMLLLAVSGGIDSVVLAELCQQSGYKFIIAHCNFQLREKESERDEEFVKRLGEKYGVRTLVKKFDTESYAANHKLSIQEAARNLRYNWFRELVGTNIASWVLTAHQADDNAETILMNFCRGTGLHGLTGIPASNGPVRRPLLSFTREELFVFAKEHSLAWVEDSSNQSSAYTRNFFRNEIIPAIRNAYPALTKNLNANIQRFNEIERLYRQAVDSFKKKLVKKKQNEYHIPVKQLMEYSSRALIYELITGFGFSEAQVDEVIKLTNASSGSFIQAPDEKHRMIKHRNWLIIAPVAVSQSEHLVIEEKTKSLGFQSGQLTIEQIDSADFVLNQAAGIACLDAREISFPLLLRKWKQGDYFYPLGMKKKKKLARFLIDQKMALPEKENTWVVESASRIIWLVNHRIDERFKVTDKTKKILRLSLKP